MSPAVWHKTKGGGHRGNQHPRWYHHQNDSKLKVQTKLNQQHPYRQQVRKHLQKVQPKLNQQHPYRQQVQKNHQKHHPYPAQLNALQAQQNVQMRFPPWSLQKLQVKRNQFEKCLKLQFLGSKMAEEHSGTCQGHGSRDLLTHGTELLAIKNGLAYSVPKTCPCCRLDCPACKAVTFTALDVWPLCIFLNPFPVATQAVKQHMLHCHQNLEPEPQIIAADPDLYVQIVRRYSVKALPIGLLANNGHVSPVGTL